MTANCEVAAGTGVITTLGRLRTNGYSGDGGAATAATLRNPYGVAVDPSDHLFIADATTSGFARSQRARASSPPWPAIPPTGYSGDGGAATAAELSLPAGVALDSTGNLYIADRSNSLIRQVSSGLLLTIAPLRH